MLVMASTSQQRRSSFMKQTDKFTGRVLQADAKVRIKMDS